MAKRPEGERAPDDWRTKFLETLARTSNVSAAARAAKIDVSSVYRARRTDPQFAQEWFGALCEGYDMLELDLLRRLRMGDVENPKTKIKRKFDNATSFRLLSAHRDTVGKMRAMIQEADEDDIIASINAKLDQMRERMREGEAGEMLALPAPTPGSEGEDGSRT